ncbi:hypothetical protein NESM_000729500 [Novymonas esmeraldas]|uniref:Uncharacterized protein n=1 Tax=Novymonas esmeraldas TaxID=1808958 RepID=A0AAW0EVK6_9TRYP
MSRHARRGSPCRSPSSPDHSPVDGQPSERLLRLLTRPRAQGGYGGRLNYTEFSTLASSLGWNLEDMDDCWYDIMMGEPCAEAADMTRVAECVCSYCLASPLPILERQSAAAVSPGGAVASATPPRLTSPSMDWDATVQLSPPTPPSRAAETVAHATPERTSTAVSPRPAHCTLERRRAGAGRSPRYTVGTASSEHKKVAAPPRPSAVSTTAHSRQRRASASPATAAPRATEAPGRAVFFRLYEDAMEQQRRRATAAPPDDDAAAECTFHPRVTPYAHTTPDGADAPYNRPTQSYFAKLTAQDRRDSLDAESPPSPRVSYHPAPGPSSTVPTGYVEGVARLRSYLASRHARASFEAGLRGSSPTDVDRLIAAPILRLPVTVDGAAEAIDVRLAASAMCTRAARPRSPRADVATYQRRCDTHHRSTPAALSGAATLSRAPSL